MLKLYSLHISYITLFVLLGITLHNYCMQQAHLDQQLYAAAARGKEERVKVLLTQQANPNIIHNLFQDTPLHTASRHGYLGIVLALLTAGANPNARTADEQEGTPLISAISKGNLAVVQALLNAGANPNTADKYGVTLMVYAALGNHVDIGLELLQRGAQMEGTLHSWQLKLAHAVVNSLFTKGCSI